MLTNVLEISPQAIISPMPEQISSELNGEVVILNLSSGVYYGLNEVGARIWELIQQPCQVHELHNVLLEEYDVPTDTCRQELLKLLLELKNACLIEVKNETSS
ncbi:PqqD family protein [Leptolyngbya cf. ectocarpi LEGE 11479]|uniref:PqqD family protein n=1 Tax=Leptolyngbya cf. ectocarpi LEGE 11479 TaxID=1828722 RepID=A0A928WYC5_LEPEC|nr:PqqD family peptide modification chaperone [Leptolyngbya ectocarpi]MBE9065715.1 PqqD family protein [Leptolyngbya cf. ectocarpi LEGE 11479]